MEGWYYTYLPFVFAVHLFGVIFWVGGMIAFSLTVYPSLAQIPNEKMFVRTALRTFNRFFRLLLPVSLLTGASGLLLAYAKDFAHRDPVLSVIVTSKELIWLLMFMLYLYAFYKTKEARERCLANDSEHARDNVRLIAWYLFGMSVLLGLCAAYFGYLLRSV